MNILVDIFQFIESALLFSILLFCVFMYIRTKDSFIRRTIYLIFPTSMLFLISFSHSYLTVYVKTYYENSKYIINNFSFLLAVFAVILIAFSINAACTYVVSLLVQFKKYRTAVKISVFIITIAFMILGIFYITGTVYNNITETLNTALWIFYPVGSLIPFFLAVSIYFYYKKIEKKQHIQLARYFLIAFTPQIIYSSMDFLVFKQFAFQFTHISYLVFSILSFYYISNHYFHSYEAEEGISIDEKSIKDKFDYSEREMEVVELLLKGKTNQNIADELYISINTVKSHIKNIYRKSKVSNRVQLIHKIKQ